MTTRLASPDPPIEIDEAALVRIASSPGSAPAILTHLAASTALTVRAAVAMNASAPPASHAILACDDDERVRLLLGRKLAALMPALPDATRSSMSREACATLRGLVADQAVRVRAAIADVLKDMADAPRELILCLARDADFAVCDPIIRLSPMLTTEDLLALVAVPPGPATALAVARRPDLNEAICDAVAATADNAAIRALLANPSAAIREATLDALIAQAADKIEWHRPLVARPRLTPRAARALAEIVADQLLAELAGRADLPLDLAFKLRQRLVRRMASPAAIEPAGEAFPAGFQADPDAEQALAVAYTMLAADQLNEAALLAALDRRQPRLAGAMLAAMAEVPMAVVDRAASLRSAKGMVSLAWKAGLTMHAAIPLQVLLARMAPSSALSPGPGGGFPLAVEEMRWQLDFLGRVGR